MNNQDGNGTADNSIHAAGIADFLGKLSGCTRSMSLYGRAHPVPLEMTAAAQQSLSKVLDLHPSVTLAIVDSHLTLDSFPIAENTGWVAALTEELGNKGVGAITFSAGITEAEVTDFAEALCISREDLLTRGGLIKEMEKRGVTHIQLKSGIAPAEEHEGKDPAVIYEEALLLIEESLEAVHAGLQIPLHEIRALVGDSLQSLISDEGALLALAGIRSYDRYLSEHSVNVCILSMVFARRLGIEQPTVVELGISAMLHDIGKVFIPEDVVRKPGKLSEEEWQQVRRHPSEGARALAAMKGLPSLAPTIALEHHANADGTGYPGFGPSHHSHLLSRLVAIADTYDALTTDRPYRERWTGQQAVAWMLYEAPNRYDRQLLARFASTSGLYPIGSLVQLMNQQIAVVVSGSMKHPTEPIIKLVSGSGQPRGMVKLQENTDPELEIKSLAQPVEALLAYTDRLLAA